MAPLYALGITGDIVISPNTNPHLLIAIGIYVLLAACAIVLFRKCRSKLNMAGFRLHLKEHQWIVAKKEKRRDAYGLNINFEELDDGGMWPTTDPSKN